ncbi:uncharacterized protein SPAPADRAFT_61999 [Spathaspora passalidarum NRRL Y-27907]|uniref:Nitrogen regulatory protein areA GATA-like domain-containing protein n=1 Tax=Spathaspora passalidarum (strain NRRL Y-27907 / 11-Y1) TaxID=619300 RepID=G3AQ89_SPAPN|nr:uncharacterized protein SPAPADRAFT_61999 [Spathaspora passalidarum NRRL Y-27907]EGW31436.1 hypothetical protein SPAPADRAFT_61999 [Spathaspora passalidarum NRRL Y-27907]
MYYYDDIVVGPSTQIPTIEQNIDYLAYVPQENTTHYLHDNTNLIKFIKYMNNNREYKVDNMFLYERLSNICWRRLYKNFQKLPEINPFMINWDKNSDVTWLFGPKIESDDEEKQEHGQEQNITLYSCEDNMSVSSFMSDTSVESCYSDEEILRKNSTVSTSSSYYDEEEDKDYNWNLKPILKKTSSESLLDNNVNQKKKVSFNYIVNTREIINGISVDYDFLDHDCL